MTAAGIVFFGGAIILIIRIVKLLLLMITAAPAMAAMVLPSTEKYWNLWLKTFIQEAIYAPVLLLLLSISLLFLNTARTTFGPESNPTASFAEVFINGNSDSVSLIIFFLIALGFLFMSIKASGDAGGMGAKTAMSFASRRVTAIAGGAVGFAGRNTIGRASDMAGAAMKRRGLDRSSGGRLVLGGLKALGNTSFDPRQLPNVKSGASAAGIDVGTVGKGFRGRADDISKDKQKYAKGLKNTPEEEETKGLLKKEIKNLDVKIEEREEKLKDQKELIKDARKKGDPLTLAAAEANAKRVEEKVKEAKSEKEDRQADLTAVENAPQLEYAKNIEDETNFTPEGTKLDAVFKRNDPGFSDEQQRHYKKLEQELSGLRDDLKKAAGATREDLLVEYAKKNREMHEFAKEHQNKTTTLLSNTVFAAGGGAQGNIDAAAAIRKANLKTKGDKDKDRDALAKAVKDAVKEDS